MCAISHSEPGRTCAGKAESLTPAFFCLFGKRKGKRVTPCGLSETCMCPVPVEPECVLCKHGKYLTWQKELPFRGRGVEGAALFYSP